MLTGNQIADQINGLEAMQPEDIIKWFNAPDFSFQETTELELAIVHVFLTAHIVCPEDDFDIATKHLDGNWPIPSYLKHRGQTYTLTKPLQANENAT